ncbi:MAG: acetate--CoA ligase family protein [Deltaproteobacteria bacterium]|nr:acetate--CoA ligase family protein [Deltaproteobacteria bacterium]
MSIEVERIKSILESAAAESRFALLEHEVYGVLAAAGCGVPRFFLLAPGQKPTPQAIQALGAQRVVLKIVSPEIIHKTDVGGVVKADATPEAIAAAAAKMLEEVPQRYARSLTERPGHAPAAYRSLSGKALEEAIVRDIRGVLVVEMLKCESEGPGSEILFGLRYNREFGPVLTVGIGGVDTELLGAACKKGMSVVNGSAALLDDASLLRIFRPTLAYQRVAGLTRGGRKLADDAAISKVMSGMRGLAAQLSAEGAGWTLQELEVNPFGVVDGKLVALDGLLKFGPCPTLPIPRPISSLGPMMKPSSIAVIGVSAKGMNMGRIILRNMIEAGFDKSRAWVVRPGSDEIDGVKCVPEIKDLPERVDLFVLAVGAEQVPDTIEALVEHDKAVGVIIIAGGMGEKEGGGNLDARVKTAIARGRADRKPLVANGGNCLGIVSRPGRYHTLFIPTTKLPLRSDGKSNVGFVSQSGAYMITRMSKLDWLSPRYAVSTGNQVDLTVGDFLRYMADDPEVKTFAVYSEGFKDGDGLACARAIKEIVDGGRDVIFYKAGRTSEGKKATSSHTASLAGEYEVCESIIAQAGAHVAGSFNDFLDLLKVSSLMGDRTWGGRRLAALSNAGYETVGIADAVRGPGWDLKLASLSAESTKRISQALAKGKLDALVDVHNPLDLTPMADDEANAAAVRTFLDDPGVDLVLCATVPLTPAMATLSDGPQAFTNAGSLVHRLAAIVADTNKPVVASVDSGVLYDAYSRALEDKGIPTFRSADVAVRILGLYAEARLSR